ncbi:hypothetical protein ACWDA3_39015 [Nonomuraea rubra]
MPDFSFLLFFVAVLGVPVMLACCTAVFAAMAAPRGRFGGVRAGHLFRGAAAAGGGLLVMALTVSGVLRDGHFDDLTPALAGLASMFGGALFLAGLGPFVPWLLGVLRPLPGPLRPAARHLADDRARTAPPVATVMVAIAVTVAMTITAHTEAAQGRAEYYPQARAGALVVRFAPEQAAAARAAVERELPGVPLAQGQATRSAGSLDVRTDDSSLWSYPYIGDRALLRYLTGNPSMSYDPGTLVTVTTEAPVRGTAQIETNLLQPGLKKATKTLPAINVQPPASGVERVFLPMEVVRDLGIQLDAEALIVDPSLYRASGADRDRIAARLGERAEVYLEQGYQAPTGWRYLAGLIGLIAVAGALVAGVRSDRSPEVARRLGAPRLLAACRAALAAICGSATGVAAGLVIGLPVAWSFSTPTGWEAEPRVPVEIPWAAIGLLTVAVPLLAAVAGLFVSGRVSGRGSRPPAP